MPLHTLATHEADYLRDFGHSCDDLDCEFHHPEVLDIVLPPETKPREGWPY